MWDLYFSHLSTLFTCEWDFSQETDQGLFPSLVPLMFILSHLHRYKVSMRMKCLLEGRKRKRLFSLSFSSDIFSPNTSLVETSRKIFCLLPCYCLFECLLWGFYEKDNTSGGLVVLPSISPFCSFLNLVISQYFGNEKLWWVVCFIPRFWSCRYPLEIKWTKNSIPQFIIK